MIRSSYLNESGKESIVSGKDIIDVMAYIRTRSTRSEGSLGEDFAQKYLLEQGWKIVEAPYQCGFGEIDIIALDGNDLVFVEVKSRSSCAYGDPVLAVTRNKQKRIIKTARCYLASAKLPAFTTCRFDVIGLIPEAKSNAYIVNHIRDAFRLSQEDMAFFY